MRKWLGVICVCLGIACLLGAIGLVLYNRWEADSARQTSRSLLENAQLAIGGEVIRLEQEEKEEAASAEMAAVRVEEYDCVGILSIPALQLELPVLADWSYEKLTKAPCHYYGAYYETDFVIAAHNYAAHFGRLSELKPGDLVVFTDVAANAYHYEVVLLETLPKEATQEMIASGFDLSLYTCTPGGGSRVTVRCSKVTSP